MIPAAPRAPEDRSMSPSDPSQPPGRQPRDPRVRTRFEALYSMGRREGAAVLADVSYTGARFAEASMVPELDTEIRAYVFVLPVNPFELRGRVVRTGDDGFAIAYKDLDPEVRRLVDDAAALVSAPGGGDGGA